MLIVSDRRSGFTLVEVMVVVAIVGMLMALFAPDMQRYLLRAKAAGVIVEAQPIIRIIQEYRATIDKSQYRLELVNGADGSISGCQPPVGSTCAASGAAPVVIVRPELLLITGGTIRVSAAPCHVDCPGYALNFSSDVSLAAASSSAPATPAGSAAPVSPAAPAESAAPITPAAPVTPTTPASPTAPVTPAAPAEPAAVDPGQSQGKGGGKGSGKGKQGALEERPGRPVLSSLSMPFVPSAHAAEAGGNVTQTNRVLYEFGEIMRSRAYAADNAACLLSTGTCTVTVKY